MNTLGIGLSRARRVPGQKNTTKAVMSFGSLLSDVSKEESDPKRAQETMKEVEEHLEDTPSFRM